MRIFGAEDWRVKRELGLLMRLAHFTHLGVSGVVFGGNLDVLNFKFLL